MRHVSGRVEKALKKVPGVSSVAVNLASEKATVEHWPGVVSFDDLQQSVEEAGYTLSRTETTTEDAAALDKQRELRDLWHRIIVSGLASIFVMLAPMNLIPGLSSVSDQVLIFYFVCRDDSGSFLGWASYLQCSMECRVAQNRQHEYVDRHWDSRCLCL